MRTLPILLALLLPLLAATSCQREASEHVTVNGKVFIFNIRTARAFYMLTLNRLPATPDNAVVRAEFEDPAGGPDLVKEQKVFANMTRIDLQSPDIDCVVTGKAYRIHVTVTDAGGKLLQELDTTLESTLDSTMLPERALFDGPVYARSKDGFNADGSIRFRKACS